MKLFKKTSILLFSGVVLAFGLVGCNTEEPVSFINASSNSPYGKVENFSVDVNSDELKAGELITFTVTPNEDYLISYVQVNGENCIQEIGENVAPNTYSWTLQPGQNRLVASFKIDPSVDVVDKFKLNVDETTFNTIMNTDDFDFREDGIEEMNLSGYRFIVDGDTTHFETKQQGYTVKVRYLGIDTPESSSELEEWGKSASLFSEDILGEGGTAKHVILQSQGRAMYPELSTDQDETVWASETDTYGRNLAYVWYSTEENPTLDDFRCMNLEMMYRGFSQGLGGSTEDMGDYYYSYFDKALQSAQANTRNYYSDMKDINYYYGDPVDLTLKEIYDTSTPGETDSDYCNEKTLYRVKGYVSRKVENSYYIQDKPSYERSASGELPEAYGMYVFTYSSNTIQVGDYVSVIGVLSEYGGSYQMSGTSYRVFNQDENRDTIIESSGHEIVPIELSAKEFEEVDYNNVLVTITDDLACVESMGGQWLLNRGGTHEIDTGGEQNAPGGVLKYPFYYDDNQIVTFGNVTGDTFDYRIKVSGEIILSHDGQSSVSYKFFSGGTNIYSSKGAKYAYEKGENFDKNECVVTEYKQRVFTELTCISQQYVSTSGATKSMQMTIVGRGDVKLGYAS